eukprot:UC1_evm3s1713
MVNHFVKRALLNIGTDTGFLGSNCGSVVTPPATQQEWAELARDLGIKTIHIAERDTQVASHPKRVNEFVNTWSVDGFIGEGLQPAELGWGTHEKGLPFDGARHTHGNDSAIYLNRPGASTRVRTWTPTEGPFHAFLITHNESISLSDYFTLRDTNNNDADKNNKNNKNNNKNNNNNNNMGKATYRPTVHYAYHPCDDAVLSLHEMAGKNWREQDSKRLMVDEIVSGIDELGVLLMGHSKGAYWHGSQLEINHSRQLCEYNSATSLQVTAAALAGVVWAMENPRMGIVEPEEMDFARCLEIIDPYVPPVVGAYSDWTPLEGRSVLFDEDIDTECPWQFKNFRVV